MFVVSRTTFARTLPKMSGSIWQVGHPALSTINHFERAFKPFTYPERVSIKDSKILHEEKIKPIAEQLIRSQTKATTDDHKNEILKSLRAEYNKKYEEYHDAPGQQAVAARQQSSAYLTLGRDIFFNLLNKSYKQGTRTLQIDKSTFRGLEYIEPVIQLYGIKIIEIPTVEAFDTNKNTVKVAFQYPDQIPTISKQRDIFNNEQRQWLEDFEATFHEITTPAQIESTVEASRSNLDY